MNVTHQMKIWLKWKAGEIQFIGMTISRLTQCKTIHTKYVTQTKVISSLPCNSSLLAPQVDNLLCLTVFWLQGNFYA